MPRLQTHTHPLLLRRGARFRCTSDGFCCSDIHYLGPLRHSDLVLLRTKAPTAVTRVDQGKMSVLRTDESGCCTLLVDGLCSLHARDGFMGKPSLCRRYPYYLVATPDGGRVGTRHRCPCRTMGDRPLLDEEAVRQSLVDKGGRLHPEYRVGPRMHLTRRSSVSFSTYAKLESDMLDALAAGTPPLTVLETEPELPVIRKEGWTDVATRWIASSAARRRSAHALLWFGSAVLSLESRRPLELHERPWADAFTRAEAGSQTGDPRAILSDWLADAIWGLEWSTACTFDVARADLTVRLMVADRITSALVAAGARSDRAAAEAVLVIELATMLPEWHAVVASMAPAS